MKLSILDQSHVTTGNNATDALRKTEELAILADELGYHRFWLAEHHSMDSYASSAPEIATAYLAAKTKNIRFGTGGTMMMHYSALKMAEVFATLSGYTNGRIDFGAGRAPGGNESATYALAEGRPSMHYNILEKFEITLKLLNNEVPTNSTYNHVISTPSEVVLPEAWLLGSSGVGATQAGKLGVGYSFAQFLNGSLSNTILNKYRNNFRPSIFLENPNIIVTYLVTTAETIEEAEFEAKPQDIWRLSFDKGHITKIMTPEEARDYSLTEIEKMTIQENRSLHLVGDIKTIANKLASEQEQFKFDEAMILTTPHSQEKRLNIYKLLAKEFIQK